ncbi:DNA translocase FtsK [Flavobacterium urocaniciphilum]|uniref:DNA segregation ATPase FtsK/SpoIIIE, S-DNA-T family n=1 Tax=Flavobacterium urocaniciphilum TaxID=1299341 RepID=A0A1H8ZN40_9FLAO|nr:DNA translocase FtsK [Flavobacterium urocaniciphilum]SEP65088.1 DNA segregation ATPase FtsK/SpoIIIE, S-DNA-T family [Flavobacterium urocaniciphilum]
MAKKETSNTSENKLSNTIFKTSRGQKFVVGVLFVIIAIILLLSFVSYYISGNNDQSQITELANRDVVVENWLGKIGAWLANLFLHQGFGVSSFLFVKIFFLIGAYLIVDLPLSKLRKIIFWDIYLIITISILFGLLWDFVPHLSGIIGFEINDLIQDYAGKIGTILLLVFTTVIFLIFKIKMSPDKIKDYLDAKAAEKAEADTIEEIKEDITETIDEPVVDEFIENPVLQPTTYKKPIIEEDEDDEEWKNMQVVKRPETTSFEVDKEALKPTIQHPSEIHLDSQPKPVVEEVPHKEAQIIETEDASFVIEKPEEEDIVEESLAQKLVQDFGEFDPTLELSNFKMPSIELLKDYSGVGITINQTELEENKNRIVETLKNYKIDIASIKATVGPTVTLYEIVPEAGIRISKIKSLEDDIALSLAALGIRIIAPIPGKGTIGIEVPNANPSMVSMKSAIASPKFQQAEMELPIALGKTISNETLVVDLAKMPHLLMAGATGQGKSVGLNAVLTSLLYKKHPAEVKFVLVDPKKVELTLFNKIERHYLAKLPDTDEAIITDNAKVINTLNSLCLEMDNRYSLLKDAMVRNIKEYNEKFKNRRLNPENGHRFLPYIVLVVDEFADLIMTAGKEVETPIARLAQLARAIGIHLIIATQRPSVNVITGMIKANFPARIAFRVTSKIDSRTILDSGGADQLIGRGDLLYTQGNDLIRVQCAFVDTPEVEKICEFIGSQKAYSNAYLLPEYVGEESGISLDIDISERDSLFRDAAEVVVTAQQGSASLIQRKLKLGYNRAGRLIDQLEAAGIVGPFEGSKARQVLIPDLTSLEQFFNNEQNNL